MTHYDPHTPQGDGEQRELRAVSMIISRTDAAEKRALLSWIDEIIGIRNSGLRKRDKLKRIAASFRHARHLTGILRSLRGVLWDERSTRFRAGLGLTAAVAALLPGQAGLAALGGAVSVPLWIVFGTGYSFALLLARELRRQLDAPRRADVIDADYEVIETERR